MQEKSYNPFSLGGKSILVTGASSGIGRSIAIECSRSGATMIITGRNEERLKESLNSMEGSGHRQIVADLQKQEDIQRLAEELPALDGVVHAAGIVKTLPFPFVTREDFAAILETNLMAPAILSQLLVKLKKMNKGSSIVFMSSISGTICAIPGNSMYSASKGAVNGLMKNMALDLAPKNIRVNSIVPGMIETGLMKDGSVTTEQLEEDMKRYPLKRYGKPEEVAWAAIYLLSDAGKWITGSSLLMDGGYTLL
jgi:NAD(P)-dependent dehydrogenase (short-subunit alcohol dehydrogenase family)